MLASALRPRLLLPFLLFVLLAYGTLTWQQVSSSGSMDRYAARTDFFQMMTGAAILHNGDAAHLYDLATQDRVQISNTSAGFLHKELLPFNHPPLLAAIFAPIYGGLGLGGSFLVWSVTNLLLLFLIYQLYCSLPLLQRLSRANLILYCLATLTYYPLFTTFLLGQTSLLLLLGLSLAYYWFIRGNEFVAGASLGLLLFKPQLLPLFLLVIVFMRRWQAVKGFAVATLAFYLLAVPAAGFDWPLGYATILLKTSNWPSLAVVNPFIMQSWRGLTSNLFGIGPANNIAFLLLAAATVALLLWLWQRTGWHPQSERWPLLFAATVIGAVLTSYHLLPHDLTVLLLPGLILAAHMRGLADGQRDRWTVVLLLGWLLPLARLAGYATLPLSLLPMLAALGLLIHELRQPTAQPQPLPG